MHFGDLISFNRAMLGKQAWRISQNPHLSHSVKFYKGFTSVKAHFGMLENDLAPSWSWQSILMGRETILSSVMWSVGNGNNIKIQEDRWLKRGVIGD